jgi:D-3-phosphoglycerate dehydrogenase
MQPTILVSESSNFSTTAANRLEQAGRVIFADLDRPALLATVSQADLLWVRLRHKIDRQVIDAAPRLRAIATPTTGLNHIDLDHARTRGIKIISLRGETAFLQKIYATGEHTLALILALVRHLPASTRHVTEGGWNRDVFRGNELHGKVAGIVGYGRIGRMVAGYLRAMGMHVIATDPAISSALAADAEIVPLDLLLAQSDLVTLHVPYAPEARGFFGVRQFAQMKTGSWFINTSRGELVDESALLDALSTKRLAGAALDVLSHESSAGMSSHLLVAYARNHDNLLITPHIGGCTLESMEHTEEFLAEKVVRFLESSSEPAVAGIAQRKDLA